MLGGSKPHDLLPCEKTYYEHRLLGLFCPSSAFGRRLDLRERQPRVIEKTLPAAVSTTPRALRSSSFTPTSNSRSRICRLNEGCAVCKRRSAAVKKLPSSATAMK